jgi:hypothetical protein
VSDRVVVEAAAVILDGHEKTVVPDLERDLHLGALRVTLGVVQRSTYGGPPGVGTLIVE